jgi:GT2 family glycosyltransferase
MNVRPATVIICTHNRAHLLPGLVHQLRTQDYPRDAFEIIVVDNLSTDHTRQVVERLAAEPGVPIRYLYESHPGVTFGRNQAAKEARHPYLAYVDDDCTIGADWLRQLLSGFDLHKQVVAVGGLVLLKWNQQERPPWLGPEMERWVAGNTSLGTSPRLLKEHEHIIECNMAVQRNTWQAAGGFIGMEQFGSRQMAASEGLYLLQQVHWSGGQVAFVPGAVVYHHVGKRTPKWMIQRAFWQGVSDALLQHLLYRRRWASVAYHIGLDTAALLVLLTYAGVSYLKLGNRKGMFHLARAIRRVGLLLGEMRLVGNWSLVRSWLSEKNPTQ